MKISILWFFCLFLIAGCGEENAYIPDSRFEGLWELRGRSTFEGIQVRMTRQNENITGKIEKLNDNKIVNMFSAVNDVWVSGIARTSNYEFKLTERKIARELFSLYGQSTSQEFYARFLNDSTIALSSGNTDPKSATIFYKRIQ